MRKILRPGASIIGVALLALASVNFEELFKSLGWNQLFIDSRGPVMDWLASPASSPWLFFASGVFLGGALFLWIDYFIRKRPAKKASQIETQMTLNFSTTLANPDRHSMSNIRRAATNKFIIPGAALGVKTKGLPVHSTDNVCVLFLIFARPIRYGEVRVTASAGPVPPYEVKDRSPEHLIIWLMGKIENCQVKVQLHD